MEVSRIKPHPELQKENLEIKKIKLKVEPEHPKYLTRDFISIYFNCRHTEAGKKTVLYHFIIRTLKLARTKTG